MTNTKQIERIWVLSIDMTSDFYFNPVVGIDFTSSIYIKLRRIILRLFEEDIESFYSVFDIYASSISYIPEEYEMKMKPFINDFLQFVVDLFNDNLCLCHNKRIIEALNNGMLFFEENIKSDFSLKNIKNLSQGFLFLFSVLNFNRKGEFSNDIAEKLINSEKVIPTTTFSSSIAFNIYLILLKILSMFVSQISMHLTKQKSVI